MFVFISPGRKVVQWHYFEEFWRLVFLTCLCYLNSENVCLLCYLSDWRFWAPVHIVNPISWTYLLIAYNPNPIDALPYRFYQLSTTFTVSSDPLYLSSGKDA